MCAGTFGYAHAQLNAGWRLVCHIAKVFQADQRYSNTACSSGLVSANNGCKSEREAVSIHRRGAKWTVKLYDPRLKRGRHIGTYSSKSEAKAAEVDYDRKLKHELERTGETIQEFYSRRQADFPNGPRGKREASTWILWDELIKPWAAKHGHRALEDYTNQEARVEATTHPRRAKALRTFFGDAINGGAMDPVHPFEGIKISRGPGRKHIVPLTIEQVDHLAEVAYSLYGPVWRAWIYGAAYNGPRVAEMMALCREDILWDDDEILFGWQFRSKCKTPEDQWAFPKNKKPRKVALFPKAKEAFLDVPRAIGGPHRPPWPGDHSSEPSGSIFLRTEEGKHFTTRTHNYYWDRVRHAAGFPKLQFHELKHFCASYLIWDLGLPWDIAALQLAHGDRALVMHYAHEREGVARDQIKAAMHASRLVNREKKVADVLQRKANV